MATYDVHNKTYLSAVESTISIIDFDDSRTRLGLIAGAVVIHCLFMIGFYVVLLFMCTQEVSNRNKMLATFQAPRCIYALLAISSSVYTLTTPTALVEDIVEGRTPLAVAVIAVTTGFHVSDTITILIGHFKFELHNKLFVFHHVLMLILYPAILISDSAYYIGCVFLLAELPVPFISVKLISLGLRWRFATTKVAAINDFLVVHCFHLRNAFDLYLWRQLYSNRHNVWDNMSPAMITIVLVFMFIMSVILVPYWIVFFNEISLPQLLRPNAHEANGKTIKEE